ncbi:uncharacterized protein VP01_1053g4 [Puccinia sorghi]|uniref:Uncharacterized protein n=1 Tax=Puccinia sorghi TaxID=27349 RepID=A0A0L6VU26_9BASI|nr:uncharacterized protein VP01_1053g4 [Puccinia sorghi]
MLVSSAGGSDFNFFINSTPTGNKSAKLYWTSKLERAAELYVQAVCNGKTLDNRFKPETHSAIVMPLKDKFPKIDLDKKKVESKFNQVSVF